MSHVLGRPPVVAERSGHLSRLQRIGHLVAGVVLAAVGTVIGAEVIQHHDTSNLGVGSALGLITLGAVGITDGVRGRELFR